MANKRLAKKRAKQEAAKAVEVKVKVEAPVLEEADLHPQRLGLRLDHGNKVGIGGAAVDLRLADAQHIHVGAVKHQNFHKNPSRWSRRLLPPSRCCR